MSETYDEYIASARERLGNPCCLMCGDDSASAIEAIDAYNREVEGVHLCFRCCDYAACAYVWRHGGAPHDTRRQYQKPAYRKDKIGRALSKQVFERDAYRCVTCGDHRDLTCDHVHPESLGGATVLENLQTMCRPCNSRKGVKLQ